MISLSHQGGKNNLEKGNAIESGLTFFFKTKLVPGFICF